MEFTLAVQRFIRLHGKEASEDQVAAWNRFKKLRNKVNNKKKQDEKVYKSGKINEAMDSPAKVWSTAQNFMCWKTTGTPSQLEVNGRLITKAKTIAVIMNNFFIEKVQLIRRGMRKVPEKLGECLFTDPE